MDLSFTVEQVMKTSPEVLFRAWTEQIDRWFAAPGSVSMKAQVNSVYYFETQFEGKRHPHYGRFLKLQPGRLIELTWMTEATKGADTIVTVELVRHRGGTKVQLTHTGFPDEESKDRHEQAWPKVLAHLDQQMSAAGS